MKKPAETSQAALLLAGFLVLVIPLAFFNSLLNAAMERTRESAMGLLREEILQTAERIKDHCRPGVYVREVIKKVHQKLLPEVRPELIKMFPAKNFGQEEFSSELPQKFLQALRKEGLDAIQILAFAPEYENAFYWHCEELQKQCREETSLVNKQALVHYAAAARLFNQNYQKTWPRLYNPPEIIQNANRNLEHEYSFTYLSRFSEIVHSHDRANQYFTDYFGRQSIFSYSYQCISPVTLHGGYSIIVPQSSIRPEAILRLALKNAAEGITVSMVDLKLQQEGFRESDEQIDFFTRPPSDFWNHYFFITSDRSMAQKSQKGGWHLKVSGRLPQTLVSQLQQTKLFRVLATGMIMLYLVISLRIWLFGFLPGGSVRLKLAFILGLIVLLPIAGTGIITWLALKGSDRVIENHLLQTTMNSIREASEINNENLLRQMLAVIEIKKRLEQGQQHNPDIKKALAVAGDDLKWVTTWTNSLNTTFETGEHFQYDTWLNTVGPNRLVHSLLNKFMDSMGILRRTKRNTSDEFSRVMTLGLMGNYITQELEEKWIPHESTVQREISHSSDTSRSAVYVIRNRQGKYQMLFHRLSSGDEHVHRYLTWFKNNLPGWFIKKFKYCDIDFGVRLRKFFTLHMFAWPDQALLSDEMTKTFERAISSRDMGYSITRKGNSIGIRAWRFKDGETAIFAAICNSRGNGLAGLATFMAFPMLLGYAVIVLYFITAIISVFVKEPVRIINSGVTALEQGNYGVFIAGFSGDEFRQMTQAFNEMSNALRQREMIKRYVSDKLIQQIQNQTDLARSENSTVKITALASDIRGFTSISEKFSPAEVVEMLNSYFTVMENVITANGGIIDKYIGDAILAIFYHDGHGENAAVRACKAAREMREQLTVFNSSRLAQGLFTIENGVGLATGMAVSGSIGTENGRKDFTVIGSVVEDAALIESRTAGCASRILLCRATADEAAHAFAVREFDQETVELI
ncbi:MAG TPA: adenylate/guanylate cyclase domain-containing protein [Candidatus Rifleibacterium sp.]|nr:adenylate/guanylate cyclase domain-containing protein [Candidatus Rifleibacterium sp.]